MLQFRIKKQQIYVFSSFSQPKISRHTWILINIWKRPFVAVSSVNWDKWLSQDSEEYFPCPRKLPFRNENIDIFNSIVYHQNQATCLKISTKTFASNVRNLILTSIVHLWCAKTADKKDTMQENVQILHCLIKFLTL